MAHRGPALYSVLLPLLGPMPRRPGIFGIQVVRLDSQQVARAVPLQLKIRNGLPYSALLEHRPMGEITLAQVSAPMTGKTGTDAPTVASYGIR